jgi:hypothetical protein
LHEFCPAQALEAVAQAEVPLQLLTPSHFTLASSASALVTATVEKARAAAVASATPDSLRFMLNSRINGSCRPRDAPAPQFARQ